MSTLKPSTTAILSLAVSLTACDTMFNAILYENRDAYISARNEAQEFSRAGRHADAGHAYLRAASHQSIGHQSHSLGYAAYSFQQANDIPRAQSALERCANTSKYEDERSLCRKKLSLLSRGQDILLAYDDTRAERTATMPPVMPLLILPPQGQSQFTPAQAQRSTAPVSQPMQPVTNCVSVSRTTSAGGQDSWLMTNICGAPVVVTWCDFDSNCNGTMSTTISAGGSYRSQIIYKNPLPRPRLIACPTDAAGVAAVGLNWRCGPQRR